MHKILHVSHGNKLAPDLTQGPLFGRLFLYSVPIMLSGILQLLYNAADNVIIGQFSDNPNSLAAIGSTGALTNLIVSLFLGLSVGTNVVVSRAFGAKNEKGLYDAIHTSVSVSIIGGLVFGVIGFLLCRPLLELMGTKAECIDAASVYMKVYFCGMPANMIYNFGSTILRSEGDTKRPLYILTLSGFVNVVFNLVFVIFFRMDVEGVALATIISQYLSAFLVILILCRSEGAMKLYLKKLSFKGYVLKELLKVGLPSGLQSCCFSLSNVIIQSAVNTFSVVAVNGNTVGGTVEGFVYITMNSYYHTCITFTGQNYGAGKFDRIKKTLFYCLLQVAVIGLAMGIILLIFGKETAMLVKNDEVIANAALVRMSVILPTYFLCGMMDVMSGQLRGIGYSFVSMCITLFGACALRILWVKIVFEAMGFNTPTDLYISYPISWFLTMGTQFTALMIITPRIKKRLSFVKSFEKND